MFGDNMKKIKYISVALFGIILYSLAGCSATIFRLPEVSQTPESNYATIVIPSNVLIERINAFRFRHCFRAETKNCAVQLTPGDYDLTVSHVTTATSMRTLNNLVDFSPMEVFWLTPTSKNSEKIRTTLEANTFYRLVSLSSISPISLIEYGDEEVVGIKRDFKGSNHNDLKRDPIRVLDYIVK